MQCRNGVEKHILKHKKIPLLSKRSCRASPFPTQFLYVMHTSRQKSKEILFLLEEIDCVFLAVQQVSAGFSRTVADW